MATVEAHRAAIRARTAVLKLQLGRSPRRSTRIPRQKQPDGIRLAYFADLRRIVTGPARAEVERLVVPAIPSLVDEASRLRGDSVRNDVAAHGRVGELIEQARGAFNTALPAARLGQLAAGYGHRTSAFQREQLRRQFRAGIGVDPILNEPGLQARVDAFTAENVSLIKSVPSQYFDQVETVLQRDIRAGARAEDVAADLVARAGVAESRAKLIARDQIGKFMGELNRVRQEALGLKGYTWRTMNDNRVRPEHEEREGEEFEWDSPPEDGAPGDAVNCRCYAEPDLSPLLEDDSTDDE